MFKSVLIPALLLFFLAGAICEARVDFPRIKDQKVEEGETLEFRIYAYTSEDKIRFDFDEEENEVPRGATLEDEEDEGKGKFSVNFVWTPDYDQDGTYDITIIADDGTDIDGETFTVKVKNANRPPDPPENPNPAEGEIIYFHEGELRLEWDEAEDPDGDTVEYVVKIDGPNYQLGWTEPSPDPFFIISELLEAGTYDWQVITIDEHGAETEGDNWEFTVGQWLETSIDATDLFLAVRKPGVYTLKWTDIAVRSNGDLAVYCEPTDAQGPGGELVQIQYGIQGKNDRDITWYPANWDMVIRNSLKNTYACALWARVLVYPQNTTGNYQGKLEMSFTLANAISEQ